MRGLQVLACLAFFGTCAGIGSSSKGDLGLAQWQVQVTPNGVKCVTSATCEAYLLPRGRISTVGAGVGGQSPTSMPHCSTDVLLESPGPHCVFQNASSRFTPSQTNQPRSWSNALAPRNMLFMLVTWPTFQPLMSWLNASALYQ